MRRNIENVPVIFVFPKLKFKFLLKEVSILCDNIHQERKMQFKFGYT